MLWFFKYFRRKLRRFWFKTLLMEKSDLNMRLYENTDFFAENM
jgi:hypothetical protein